MRLSVCVTIILVLAVLIAPPYASAVELTGNEAVVLEMFESFYELESEFRSGKWDEAAMEFNDVEATYIKIIRKLRGQVGSKLFQATSSTLKEVKTGIGKKDAEAVEGPYMKVQGYFIDIMEQLDYPSPPVLIIIDNYIEEAQEFLEKGDLNQVAEEMEEVEHFKYRALDKTAAAGMDAKKLEPLFEMAEDVKKMAVKGKSKSVISKRLKSMESLLGGYVN